MNNLIDIEYSIRRLNRVFFVAIIPALSILVPLGAGMISGESGKWGELLFSYVYFLAVSMLIWKGNNYLYLRRREIERTRSGYFELLTGYMLACMFYAGFIAVAGLLAWQVLTNQYTGSWKGLAIACSIVMIIAMLINGIWELLSGKKEMAETVLKFRKMEIAKSQAELEALKAQIDPHFIFNSLNTLSYLIANRPETAKLYNETLASVYRYILSNKDKDLVLLRDELEFIEIYFYLVKIRFEDAVNLAVEISEVNADKFLITPISLQMLIENAIKHNCFSTCNPLEIRINIQPFFVTVTNGIKRKDYQVRPSGIGLRNLKERYRLIMKKNIIIHRENEEFVVKVPILKV